MSVEEWPDLGFDAAETYAVHQPGVDGTADAGASADVGHVEVVGGPRVAASVSPEAARAVREGLRSGALPPNATLDTVAEVYAELRRLKMLHRPLARACVERVWAMRDEWLVVAHVPEKDEHEHAAWVHVAALGAED